MQRYTLLSTLPKLFSANVFCRGLGRKSRCALMIIVCGRALGVAADCSETSTKSYAGLGPSGVLTWMACCLDSKKRQIRFLTI